METDSFIQLPREQVLVAAEKTLKWITDERVRRENAYVESQRKKVGWLWNRRMEVFTETRERLERENGKPRLSLLSPHIWKFPFVGFEETEEIARMILKMASNPNSDTIYVSKTDYAALIWS